MARDSQHQKLTDRTGEIEHLYGPNVHILSSVSMLSLLARLGHPETRQPTICELVTTLYNHLLDHVVDRVFPRVHRSIETRMKSTHPEATYEGEAIDPETSVAVVDLARAGTLPSQLCYTRLNYLMNPDKIRQDHFYIARVTNENNEVIGVNVSGSKIGGGCDQSLVLFPDPMGATGGTIVEVYNHYMNKVGGKPRALVAMHLIVTPEYLARVTKACPELRIFALRLDRGLSSRKVLDSIPGTYWQEEKGLNQHHYIVPGAGGVGEILNNSYC